MEPGSIKALELVLVFGGVLGWAVWELIKVRRSIREDERKAEQAKPPGE